MCTNRLLAHGNTAAKNIGSGASDNSTSSDSSSSSEIDSSSTCSNSGSDSDSNEFLSAQKPVPPSSPKPPKRRKSSKPKKSPRPKKPPKPNNNDIPPPKPPKPPKPNNNDIPPTKPPKPPKATAPSSVTPVIGFASHHEADKEAFDYIRRGSTATTDSGTSVADSTVSVEDILEQSGMVKRISVCFGVPIETALQIREVVENSKILVHLPKSISMPPAVRKSQFYGYVGNERVKSPRSFTVSVSADRPTPLLASVSAKGIIETMTVTDYNREHRDTRSLHDSVIMRKVTRQREMSDVEDGWSLLQIPGVDDKTTQCIYELIQLLRTPPDGSKRERVRVGELVNFLADKTWPVATWCDAVYYADKTNRSKMRDKIIKTPVRFVALSAAESGVLGTTEQLYMVKRIPKDMIQNTGLRQLPARGASSRHCKVRNGAIVRLATAIDDLSSTAVASPVIWDGSTPFVFVQLLSLPGVQGYIRLHHLHPYRLVSVNDCPPEISGELRRKVGVMWQRSYFKLESGVLDCYSDAVRQKLLMRYYLATAMYAYQSEKDNAIIRLKFKSKKQPTKRKGSSAVSIGKSITLGAKNAAEAHVWTDHIGLHCAWLNWQSQSDDRKKKQLINRGESCCSVSVPPPPGSGLSWTYTTSWFQDFYAKARAPNTVLGVLEPLHAMISLFTEMSGLTDHKNTGETLYRQLENEIFEYREAHKQVDKLCQRLWTSTLRLDVEPSDTPADNLRLELCSIINRCLQKDGLMSPSVSAAQRAQLVKHTAVICRGINTIRATGSDDANELVRAGAMYTRKKNDPFPPGGVTWRGGGFPAKHRSFFVEGVKFRAPCFLATSFNKETAEDFRKAAGGKGHDTIMWRIEVDPEGESNPNRRCFQVNYVRQTVVGLPDEQEFLFTQFSPFQVKNVIWSDNPREDPHQITLYALQDSQKERDNLPLSPWN